MSINDKRLRFSFSTEYLLAIFSILASKSDIRSLQMKNRRLSEELNDLRNVAIDEGIYDTEDGDY